MYCESAGCNRWDVNIQILNLKDELRLTFKEEHHKIFKGKIFSIAQIFPQIFSANFNRNRNG